MDKKDATEGTTKGKMMNEDPYLKRVNKKVDRLVSRIFTASPDGRAKMLEQIRQLREGYRTYKLNQARVHVPGNVFKRKLKYVK